MLGRTTEVAKKPQSSGSNYASWTDKLVCISAITGDPPPRWELQRRYLGEVNEAKRRGLTPLECARILGRTTEVASTAKPSGSYASSTDDFLCSEAITLPHQPLGWNISEDSTHNVAEAKRRGFTPQQCARILGRTTQVANKKKPFDIEKIKNNLEEKPQRENKIVDEGSSQKGRLIVGDNDSKSFKRKMCESAKSNSTMLASFMQNLSQDELAKFLGADQNCSMF